MIGSDGSAQYLEELPVDYVHQTDVAAGESYFTITLEYGPDHDHIDPFDISIGRISQSDSANSDRGRYLHPVIRHYRDGIVAEHHMTENLENEWTSEQIHCQPLRSFFARQIASRAVPATAGERH